MRPDPYKQARSRKYKKQHNIPSSTTSKPQFIQQQDVSDINDEEKPSPHFSKRKIVSNAYRYNEDGEVPAYVVDEVLEENMKELSVIGKVSLAKPKVKQKEKEDPDKPIKEFEEWLNEQKERNLDPKIFFKTRGEIEEEDKEVDEDYGPSGVTHRSIVSKWDIEWGPLSEALTALPMSEKYYNLLNSISTKKKCFLNEWTPPLSKKLILKSQVISIPTQTTRPTRPDSLTSHNKQKSGDPPSISPNVPKQSNSPSNENLNPDTSTPTTTHEMETKETAVEADSSSSFINNPVPSVKNLDFSKVELELDELLQGDTIEHTGVTDSSSNNVTQDKKSTKTTEEWLDDLLG